jgi:hypothetical protein
VLTGDYLVAESDICTFTDVEKSDATTFYPDNFVAVCAARGITVGKTATTFDPYASITRQQLISMVVRAANLSDPPTDYTPTFSPGQFYPEEHYLNARKAAYAGLLDGLQGIGPTYDFMAPVTRGECAQVLHNLLVELTPPTTTTTTSSSTTTTVAPTITTTTSSSTTTTTTSS